MRRAASEPAVVDKRLSAIHLAQSRHRSLDKVLDRAIRHGYAICATKPGEGAR